MSMQALNRLVARSIIDTSVVQAFGTGRIGDVLSELDFTPEMRLSLTGLDADSWSEFAIQAYRLVKAAERPVARVELPSPLEGLIGDQDSRRTDIGQVA